jgi:hypothetical protein
LQFLSLIERLDPDFSCPILPILDVDRPRLTAHLAILDVLLGRSPAWIKRDLDRLIAVRAVDHRRGFRGSIAKGKLGIDRFFFVR